MPDYLPVSTAVNTLAGSSGVVTNASAAASLAASALKTTYISQFSAFFGGATVGSIVNITVAGLLGGTQTFPVAVPTGALLGSFVDHTFTPPLPASGINGAIVVTMPAAGAGNTAQCVNVSGFTL